MNADPTTLIATAAGAVAVACVVFTVTTLQRHHDRPNRLAAASLLATVLGLVAGPAVGAFDDVRLDQLDTTAIKAAAVVAAVGLSAGALLFWSAARAFAGRPPQLAAAGCGVAVVAAVSGVVVGSSTRWVWVPAVVAMAIGLVLAIGAVRGSSMASNLNSRIQESALGLAAVGVIGIGVLVVLDRTSAGQTWAALAAVAAAVAIVEAMTLMALRVERYGNWWTLGEDLDRSELGVDERDEFVGQARDRIQRCEYAVQRVHVITTALPGLNELNLAYGHLAGDAALRWVAELLRRQAPASAVLGHLGAGRFAIVTSREPELVANAIQNGMMRVPPPASLPVRLTPVFAWSSSDEVGFDYDKLRQSAEERLSHVS